MDNRFNFYALIVACIALFFLVIFKGKDDDDKALNLVATNLEIEELAKQIDKTNKKLRKLDDNLFALELEGFDNAKKSDILPRSCLLNAKKQGGWEPIFTKSGSAVFYINITNVIPHLDGYKITFFVGNPMQASFEGLSISVLWWFYDKTGEKSVKSQSIDVDGKIFAGRWHTLEAFLSPLTEKGLEELEIHIFSSSAFLLNNPSIQLTCTVNTVN